MVGVCEGARRGGGGGGGGGARDSPAASTACPPTGSGGGGGGARLTRGGGGGGGADLAVVAGGDESKSVSGPISLSDNRAAWANDDERASETMSPPGRKAARGKVKVNGELLVTSMAAVVVVASRVPGQGAHVVEDMAASRGLAPTGVGVRSPIRLVSGLAISGKYLDLQDSISAYGAC